ncbi:MAG: hypothetical protein J0I12_13685 [Candidatus Eremiobacteraeota bacterium]|nr:hypothetical protein [Candidatus Eremiobacteraeota bacterium]
MLLLFLIALALLMAPYLVTRLVLKATLASYKDKTSPAAAAGVRNAAVLCAGLGLTLSALFINSCGGLSDIAGWVVIAGLLSQWTAIALPLRVKANAAPAPSEVGFSRF